MATLRQKEPKKDCDQNSDGRDDDFDNDWPIRSIQQPNSNCSDQGKVKRTTCHDDFFGEGEVSPYERMCGTIIGMPENPTINYRFDDQRDNTVA